MAAGVCPGDWAGGHEGGHPKMRAGRSRYRRHEPVSSHLPGWRSPEDGCGQRTGCSRCNQDERRLKAGENLGRTGNHVAANPISIAIPRKNATPIVVDISTSAIAEGKVRGMFNRKEPVPPGNIMDVDGVPTTDAAKFYGPPGRRALSFLAGIRGSPWDSSQTFWPAPFRAEAAAVKMPTGLVIRFWSLSSISIGCVEMIPSTRMSSNW